MLCESRDTHTQAHTRAYTYTHTYTYIEAHAIVNRGRALLCSLHAFASADATSTATAGRRHRQSVRCCCCCFSCCCLVPVFAFYRSVNDHIVYTTCVCICVYVCVSALVLPEVDAAVWSFSSLLLKLAATLCLSVSLILPLPASVSLFYSMPRLSCVCKKQVCEFNNAQDPAPHTKCTSAPLPQYICAVQFLRVRPFASRFDPVVGFAAAVHSSFYFASSSSLPSSHHPWHRA